MVAVTAPTVAKSASQLVSGAWPQHSPRAVAAAPVRRLLDDVPLAALQVQRDDAGHDEEDDVHDGEGEAGLEHGARLVDVDAERPVVDDPGADDDGVAVARHAAGRAEPAVRVAAVGVGDAAQVVDARDQRAREAQVDEGHEVPVAPHRRPLEQRHQRPRAGQRGHDEEHQDVRGRQLVLVDVAVDEVGLQWWVSGADVGRVGGGERRGAPACR